MFGIDIPSWLTFELITNLFIIIGVVSAIIAAIYTALTFNLKRKRSAEEKAEKDSVEVYRPLFEDVSKMTKSPIDHPLTYYKQYPERYLELKKGRIAPPIYDALKTDMDKLIISWNEVGESFEKFDNMFQSFSNVTLDNILLTRKDGTVHALRRHYDPLVNTEDVLKGNKEKCISYLKGKIEDIDKGGAFEKVDLKQSPEQIINQLFSLIENEKKDYLSKREKMLKKAEEVKEKLYNKTRHQKKRYGNQLKK